MNTKNERSEPAPTSSPTPASGDTAPTEGTILGALKAAYVDGFLEGFGKPVNMDIGLMAMEAWEKSDKDYTILQAPIREAKADPAQADGWFHCEICGKAGEDVSERDFPGLDGETYQLYAHPGCGKPPKISFDLDPAQPTEEK